MQVHGCLGLGWEQAPTADKHDGTFGVDVKFSNCTVVMTAQRPGFTKTHQHTDQG